MSWYTSMNHFKYHIRVTCLTEGLDKVPELFTGEPRCPRSRQDPGCRKRAPAAPPDPAGHLSGSTGWIIEEHVAGIHYCCDALAFITQIKTDTALSLFVQDLLQSWGSWREPVIILRLKTHVWKCFQSIESLFWLCYLKTTGNQREYFFFLHTILCPLSSLLPGHHGDPPASILSSLRGSWKFWTQR